jgi:hypothetical protein
LPKEEKVKLDLGLQLNLLPIEIIYQAHAVENISRFFKVKKLSTQTKIAAKAQFDVLSKQLTDMTMDLNADFKTNRIDIRIDAPTLVVPLNQNTREAIEQSYCWVFTVGAAKLQSVT